MSFTFDTAPLYSYLSNLHETVFTRLGQVTAELQSAKAQIEKLEATVASTAATTKATESLSMAMSAQMVTRSQFQKTVEAIKGTLRELDPTLELSALSAGGGGTGGSIQNSNSSPQRSLNATAAAVLLTTSIGGNTSSSMPRTFSTASSPANSKFTKAHSENSEGEPSSPALSQTPSTSHQLPSRSQIIRQEITSWYNEIGVRDAEERHKRTTDNLSRKMTQMQEQIQERVTQTTLSNSIEGIRKDMKNSNEETLLLKKKVVAQEEGLRSLEKRETAARLEGEQKLSNRIHAFYDILCITEESVVGAGMSGDSHHNHHSVRNTTSDNTSSMEHHHTSNGREKAMTPILDATREPPGKIEVLTRSSSVSGSPPSAVLGPEDMHGPHSDVAALLELGISDPRSIAVLQSPVFSAFRQAMLNDITERVSSSRHAQSSDVGLELLALRNDVRQRTTVPRVVELIQQYANQSHTLAKWDQMERRMTEMSKMAVHGDDFVSGLKTKVDLCQWDQKVDRVELECKIHELTDLVNKLKDESNMAIAEAKAMARTGARIGPTVTTPLKLVQHADDADAVLLPSIVAGDVRAASNNNHNVGRSLTSSSSDRAGAAPSRQTPNTNSRAQHNKSGMSTGGGGKNAQLASIKPLTESRAQSQNVNPFSPRPPAAAATAAVAVSPQWSGEGPAIPMTSNQEAYARIVSEEQMRHMLETLPPLPYNS